MVANGRIRNLRGIIEGLAIISLFLATGCAPIFLGSCAAAGGTALCYLQNRSYEMSFLSSYSKVWNATLRTLEDLSLQAGYKKGGLGQEEIVANSPHGDLIVNIKVKEISANLTKITVSAKKGWLRVDRSVARAILFGIQTELESAGNVSLAEYEL